MQGVDAFRMRVGDFRVIYHFNVEKNEVILIAVGNRREASRDVNATKPEFRQLKELKKNVGA